MPQLTQLQRTLHEVAPLTHRLNCWIWFGLVLFFSSLFVSFFVFVSSLYVVRYVTQSAKKLPTQTNIHVVMEYNECDLFIH